jgi:hypothetical protein
VPLIEQLNVSLQPDANNDGLFREITGRTLDQLWAEYQKEAISRAGSVPARFMSNFHRIHFLNYLKNRTELSH